MFKVKKYKVARRLGAGVFEKAQTQKFVLSEGKRARKRGRRPRISDYGQQLIEKQKVRYVYGVSEKQFRNYVNKALDSAKPAQTLFELLEQRLDNTVYRMGLASTRRMARQMTTHGHFTVNGKRMNVPSHVAKEGDQIAVREGSQKSPMFADLDKKLKNYTMPKWLSFDAKAMSGQVKGIATDPDPFLNFQAVIEFYSR